MRRKTVTIFFLIASFMLIGMSFKRIHGKIVCFGDSITFGALVNGHSWVWYLSQEYKDVNFVNAGRSGRKTADKKELLPVLGQNSDADCYLIFLGVNDLKDGTDSMVNNCVDNMRWMVSEIKKENEKAKIVILAPCDINLETMNDININKKYNQHTKQSLYVLEKKYKQLAKEEGTGFISLLHTVSKPNYVDGLHPNADGQMELAKAVWKGLKKIK